MKWLDEEYLSNAVGSEGGHYYIGRFIGEMPERWTCQYIAPGPLRTLCNADSRQTAKAIAERANADGKGGLKKAIAAFRQQTIRSVKEPSAKKDREVIK